MSVTPSSLSDVLSLVGDAVKLLFTDALWMTAEVLQVSNGRHKYLELVEYDANRKEVAKGRGTIWADDVGILANFQKVTGNPLASGMKILFRAKPSFNPVYGLSLAIKEIDPVFTVGLMTAQLNEYRAQLKKQNLWDKNRHLRKPGEFCRLAVISPAEAAGLGDFRVVADRLDARGLCTFEYFPAVFQGPGAGDRIFEQMVKVNERHKIENFDALVIIRGGGDKAGLYHLNHWLLAKAVCRFPIPVMVGIGHDRDEVLIDEVANQSFSTPSLLVSHIRSTIIKNAQKAQADAERIVHLVDKILNRAENQCESLKIRLFSTAEQQLDKAESTLKTRQMELLHSATTKIAAAEQEFEHKKAALVRAFEANMKFHEEFQARLRADLFIHAERSIQAAQQDLDTKLAFITSINPVAILARGYGYLRKGDGYVRSVNQVKAGDALEIQLQDGAVSVEVKGVCNESK
jgi:exodeoxyribonuclease VII large subunit